MVDIRYKVDEAFSQEKVHVAVQAEPLGCLVNPKRLPGEFKSDEKTHGCTESDLGSAYNLGPNDGTGVICYAKRHVKLLSDNRCIIRRTTHILLYGVHDMKTCFTYL